MELFIDSEFRSLIPPLAPEELSMLEQNLISEGNRVPIDTWQGYIVDGHNRYDICQKHNIPLKPANELSSILTRNDVKIWIIRNQFGRRNLNNYKRSKLALKLKALFTEKGRQNECAGGNRHEVGRQNSDNPIDTKKELANIAQVSHDTIAKVEVIENQAPEFIKQKAESSEISIHQAYQDTRTFEQLSDEDKPKVEELVTTGKAKNVITARKIVQREKAKDIKPPNGKYQLIYADPPWEYEFGFDIHGAACRHYNTMTVEEICNLEISKITDDNAVLFLWATSPKLREGLKVMDAWGFDYKTSFIWDKVGHVMGHYNSVRHEFLLIGIKGTYPKQSNTLHDSVVTIERSEIHSQKPEEFREIINEMYPGAEKIELFAGDLNPISGWTRWGMPHGNAI